jgi:RNase P subunit RPR2
MRMQDALPKSFGATMPWVCVRCEVPLKIKTIFPLLSADKVDEVVYSCPGCGMESRRTIRGAD